MGNVQDVEVGPIWNQSHAEEVAAEYIQSHPDFEWTGQWETTRPGEMSTIQIRRREQLDVDDLVDGSPPSSFHRPPRSVQDPEETFQTLLPGIDSAIQALQQGLTSFLDERLNSVLSGSIGQASGSRNSHAPGQIGHGSLASDWEVLNTADYDDSDDSDDDEVFPTAPVCHPRPNLVETDTREATQAGQIVDAPNCSEVMELVAMFPEIAESIICELLENNNYDVEKTTEELVLLDPSATQASSGSERRSEATSDNSLPIPSCPVCYEALKPPKRIFQCTNGHLVCEICQRQPQLRGCPTCRQPIMGRATAMEQLLADLQKRAQTKN